MTIVKRTGLGRPMTWSELDGNWDQLQESTVAAQQSAALAAASQTAAATSESNAAASAAEAANQAEAAGTLRTDLASTDVGKGLSLTTAEDGTSGQEFYDNADQFAGAYEDAVITVTSVNRWITYNGTRWYVKPGTTVPFTTTGLNATSWAVDSANFIKINIVSDVESVSDLTNMSGTNGDLIKVASYYENGSTGGGFFVFDETRSSENDGVYCINGWVRDISSGIITDYDAGLVSNDGSDATTKVQSILHGLPDGYEFKCYGYHSLSSIVWFSGKSNIKISGPGTLSSKELRDSWSWINVSGFTDESASSDDGVSGYPLGIVSWINCSNVDFSLNVQGGFNRFTETTSVNARKREYGDTGVYFFNSPYSKVHNCEIQQVWGWGILGMGGSDYSEAFRNRIHDTTMQSGINIVGGNSHTSSHDNTIYNCGLYGIEMETFSRFSNSVGNVSYSNKISTCKWGIAIVSNSTTASATSNIIDSCYFGVSVVGMGLNPTRVVSSYNTIENTCYPLHLSGSQNVSFSKNTCINESIIDYLILDQYASIVYIDPSDRTIFRTVGSATFATTSININGGSYTISSTTTVSDSAYTYGESSYTVVTLSSALSSDVLVGMTLLFPGSSVNPVGMITSKIQQSTTNDAYVKNCSFDDNLIRGWFYSGCQILTGLTSSQNLSLSFIGNKMINDYGNTYPFYRVMRTGGWSDAIEWIDNQSSNSMSFSVPTKSGATDYTMPEQIVHAGSVTAVASGTAFPVHQFYIPKDRMIIGVDVVMTNVSSTSNISLNISDSVTLYPTIMAANSTPQDIVTYSDRTLVGSLSLSLRSGRNWVQIYTSGNVASASSYDVYLRLL